MQCESQTCRLDRLSFVIKRKKLTKPNKVQYHPYNTVLRQIGAPRNSGTRVSIKYYLVLGSSSSILVL